MKALLVFLLFLVHVLMSYGGSLYPWRAISGSLLIILIARTAWPERWNDRLGLRIRLRDGLLAAVLVPILIAGLYWMIRAITITQGISFHPVFAEYGFLNLKYLHTLGQTLNEEMLFGALILYAAQRRFSNRSLLSIAVSVALIFSGLHYVFYRWIVISENTGILTTSALFVLFAIGVLRNTLILKTGSIIYAWCTHFSLNFIGLIGTYNFANGVELTEPEVLNFVLGSKFGVAAATIIILGSGIFLLKSLGQNVQ